MKFVILLIACLTLVSTQVESRSRSDYHHYNSWHSDGSHREGPHRSHETDRSSWTPFKREDNNLINHESDDSSVNSTDSPTESREHEGFDFRPRDHKSPEQREPSDPSAPIVRIDWGTIEGVIETHAGANVSVFYGIPYAEPPVGRLRYRLPVKIEGRYREGIYNATTPKPACMQSLTGTPIDEPVSEDCLHVNIWVPREEEENEREEDRSPWSRRSSSHHEDGFINSRWWSSGHRSEHQPSFRERSSDGPSRKYPVLFYIYGSQFKKHSSTYPKNRGGVLAAKGKMVFVGINYRLQSFGFAYGGDRHMPGNQALYDILTALEWTRENIAAFGGNPNKITVAGSSAGSELAAMLTLSPNTSPFLYDQLVLMSNAPQGPGSIESPSVALNKTKALAAKLGCGEFPNHDFTISYDQLDCLQAANATTISEADITEDLNIMGSSPDFAFMPIYGDDFMPTMPELMLLKKQARRNMKILTGSDHNDDVETLNYQPASRAEAEGHLDNMFTNMVKPEHNISHELDYIYDYYFDGVSDNDTWSLKERLSQLIGDNMVQCPLLLTLEKWATLDPIHYYYYNYTADAFVNSTEVKNQHGPTHGSANFMFLGLPFSKDEYSDRDRLVSHQMINILSDFVHKGEIPWPPMLVSRRNKVLPLEWVIDERVDTHNIKVNPKLDICRFIAKLYKDSI